MGARQARVALAVVVGLASGCGYRTPQQRQRDWAERNTPKPLGSAAPSPSSQSAVRVVRVHALADAAYRSQHRDYERSVEQLFERANRFLAPALSVRLQVLNVSAWEHTQGTALEPMLKQLAVEHSTSDGVDLVFGFTSSLNLFSSTFEDLGRAQLFGRHAVLRGIDQHETSDMIMTELRALDVSERAAVVRARIEHQETAVLLHELGHLLGAVHEREPRTMMSAQYSSKSEGFSAPGIASARLGLEYLDRPGERGQWLRKAHRMLAQLPAGTLEPDQLGWAKELVETEDGGSPHPAADAPLTAADSQLLDIAIEKARAGRAADALSTVAGVLSRAPNNRQVQTLGCQLEVMADEAPAKFKERCAKAMALSPGDLRPTLALAHGLMRNKDTSGARAAALEGSRRAGTGTHDPAVRLDLARTLLALGELDAAEEQAKRAEGAAQAPELLEQIAADRRAGGRGPAGQAPATRDCNGEATRLQRWVGAPSSAGRAAVAAVLKACPQSGRVHFVAGTIDEAAHMRADAISHYERAVALEPGIQDAWRRLLKLYTDTRMVSARESLLSRYQSQFGRPLE